MSIKTLRSYIKDCSRKNIKPSFEGLRGFYGKEVRQLLPDSMYEYRHEHPRRVVADICSICHKNIYVGDTYYSFNGEIVCEESLDEYTGYFRREAE